MDIQGFDNLNVAYDVQADVLYMTEGAPRLSVSRMVDDGVIIRMDPESREVVGFTIVDFISNFSTPIPHSIPIMAKFQTVPVEP